MKVGVFIPAYNAARTLASVLDRVPDLPGLEAIWIVNDGSSDHTAAVARRVARRREQVAVVDLPRNRGYGGAVKEGLRAAAAADVDVAACVHADGQYAPEELPRLLGAMDRARLDILQGSRIASGTALGGGMPLYKWAANRVLTTMENRVFGLRMSDYHSGYMLYGARALRRLPFARLSDNFDFDLEVIACAQAMGLAIGERPISTHYGDEVSHLNSCTYGLRVLRVMLRNLSGRYHRYAGVRR